MQSPPPVPESVWQNPWYFIAFGFGSGAMPFAPGTFGTLFAIPFFLLLQALPLIYYFIFLILFIIFSSILCERLSKDIGIHDHQGMCIDEFAGFFVTMFGVPPTFGYILGGFLLFRFFDIVKPWPINFVDEKMNSGFGMILDDVIAGIYSLLILHLFLYYQVQLLN